MRHLFKLGLWLKVLVVIYSKPLAYLVVFLAIVSLIELTFGFSSDGIDLHLGTASLSTGDSGERSVLWVLSASWLVLGLGILFREPFFRLGLSAGQANDSIQRTAGNRPPLIG